MDTEKNSILFTEWFRGYNYDFRLAHAYFSNTKLRNINYVGLENNFLAFIS